MEPELHIKLKLVEFTENFKQVSKIIIPFGNLRPKNKNWLKDDSFIEETIIFHRHILLKFFHEPKTKMGYLHKKYTGCLEIQENWDIFLFKEICES